MIWSHLTLIVALLETFISDSIQFTITHPYSTLIYNYVTVSCETSFLLLRFILIFCVPVYDFVSFAAICVKNVFFSPLFYVVYFVNVDPWGVVVLLIFMLCSVTLLRKTLCCNPRVLLDTWTNSWLNCDNEDIYIFCLFKIT